MTKAGTRTWVTRGALTGAMVSAGFGAAWSLWGASGLDGLTALVVGAAGVIVGLGVVLLGLQRWQSAPADDASMFRARPYRVIVLVEFAALIAGSAVLGATGHDEYVPVWYAAVVGAHFVAFGRTFWRGFLVLGALLLLAALAGLVVGLSGGDDGAIVATTALLAAIVLLGAGSMTVLQPRRGRR